MDKKTEQTSRTRNSKLKPGQYCKHVASRDTTSKATYENCESGCNTQFSINIKVLYLNPVYLDVRMFSSVTTPSNTVSNRRQFFSPPSMTTNSSFMSYALHTKNRKRKSYGETGFLRESLPDIVWCSSTLFKCLKKRQHQNK